MLFRSIQRNTGKTKMRVRKPLLCVSIIYAIGMFSLQSASAQVDFSTLNQYLPDSLQKIYPSPGLADDDVIFAVDSTGAGLYANFVANRGFGRVLVVDPNLGKDSGLIWLSPEVSGRIEYLYTADINGDGFEELVLATRKLGAEGWSRLYIWRWEKSKGQNVVRCLDNAPEYFSAPTRAQVKDTDDDGVFEIILSAVGTSGTDSLIYYWTDKGYCAKPE